jgi:hypothetical protein
MMASQNFHQEELKIQDLKSLFKASAGAEPTKTRGNNVLERGDFLVTLYTYFDDSVFKARKDKSDRDR